MGETNIRSVVKSVSWRTLATITTAILVFIFTGNIAIALSIGALEFIVKLILYFIHERTWNKIRWGKLDTVEVTEKLSQ